MKFLAIPAYITAKVHPDMHVHSVYEKWKDSQRHQLGGSVKAQVADSAADALGLLKSAAAAYIGRFPDVTGGRMQVSDFSLHYANHEIGADGVWTEILGTSSVTLTNP